MTQPKDELIKYRLQRAESALEEAGVMADMQHWETCINRLYYACFYAVNALLLNLILFRRNTRVFVLFLTAILLQPVKLINLTVNYTTCCLNTDNSPTMKTSLK
jgi:uncharacterized protein (UPF0332 family)